MSNGGISVRELHTQLTFHVIRAGVGRAAWAKIAHHIERRSAARQEYIRRFLMSLRDVEWKAVNDTWNLPNATPEMWDNMLILYEDQTFPEVIRLKRCYRALRERWIAFKIVYKDYIRKERESSGTQEIEE